MNQLTSSRVILFSLAAVCLAWAVVSYRNNYVAYTPTTLEALDALPPGALIMRDGGFFIQRKNLP